MNDLATVRQITETTLGQAVIQRFAKAAGKTETMITALIMTNGELTSYFLEVVGSVIES
tara:strand:+ start:700 stop:876 length:177 start_codon:yes stop_codon:yes gene_type:complete